ncbi:unnamed protein product [Nyctereutes procyonoides]|uniref:(raccoon dog) hypothetical protein n=1 Tax=Nyctereutes procyonoides TaxID=34880 RepID=A0A811Y5W5_NYCPR|nr:unnamed protein product [Nyctereutes procyonoides]
MEMGLRNNREVAKSRRKGDPVREVAICSFCKRETSGDVWLKLYNEEASNWSDQQFSSLACSLARRQLPRKAFPAELPPPPPEEALLPALRSLPPSGSRAPSCCTRGG